VSRAGQRGSRGRAVPGPGQASLLDVLEESKLAAPTPCLYRTGKARGLAARLAEFDAWKDEYGNWGSLRRSHAWTGHSLPPGVVLHRTYEDMLLDRCEPAILAADLSRRDSDPVPPCGCDGPMLYRAACRGRGCTWEGPERERENPAAEDGLDHAWPGWRDLPAVPGIPDVSSGTSARDRKTLAAWAEKVNAVYPDGWLGAGGPIRTVRDSPRGGRHVPARTPYGGYDLAIVVGPRGFPVCGDCGAEGIGPETPWCVRHWTPERDPDGADAARRLGLVPAAEAAPE